MLVSYNWIKKFTDISSAVSVEELADKLTMSTVEVEGITKQATELENIVLAEVIKVDKHPDADRLSVCKVFDGTNKVQVVCGGSNVSQGMKCAFAKVGTQILWHGQGEKITLEKTTIRGVESNGMICAAGEIGLGDIFITKDEKEILDLTHIEAKPGTSLSMVLDWKDAIIDIDNKSMTHRPDLWGHYGMAREVSALYNKKLVEYKPKQIKAGKEMKISADIEDSKLCPRYMAVAIDGIEIKPSPVWMQKLLIAVGLRPINNIVDITNYIMLELGQPMHAFDSNLITGDSEKKIIVRKAKDQEKFTTLDDKQLVLDDRDLVIADQKNAIALAGIMGGQNSEIQENTSSIILESANFDSSTIRRSALRLGQRTESSSRFEKSLDPNNCELAINRAVELIQESCPEAIIISNIADNKDFSLNQGPIELDWDFLNMKIGVEIDKKEVINILQSLGFEVKEKKQGLSVRVPSHRATKDISIAEDLVEEVSRIYGYDNIEPKLPSFPIVPPQINELRKTERAITKIITQTLGYSETYNYSFISKKQILNSLDDITKYIELDNPISKEKPYLRRSLLQNLLENTAKNIEFFDQVKIMEIGKVFRIEEAGAKIEKNSDELLPRQDSILTLVYTNKKDVNPFFEVRKVIEVLTQSLNENILISPIANTKVHQHPVRSAEMKINGNKIGNVYELHPLIAKNFGIATRVGVVEININTLVENIDGTVQYSKISAYPEITRDISIVLEDTISYDEIINTIKDIDLLLKNINIFDVYQGKNIGDGYKSMAFHLIYGSNEKTLESKEIDKIQEKIIKTLEKKFNAEIRQ